MRTILRLGRCAVIDMADIAQIDRRAVDLLDRQIVELVDHAGTIVELYLVFELADFDGARRNDLILRRQRIFQILGRKLIGLQRPGSKSIWTWRTLPP